MNINHLNIIILCFVITANACSPVKTAIPDTVREGLQGPVKRVLWQQENSVWSNKQRIDFRLENSFEDQYDRHGYKTHHQMYTWIDTLVNGEPFGNHPAGLWKYSYNQAGYRIKTETVVNSNRIMSFFYQYRDRNGNIVYEKSVDNENQLILEWIVERDEQNKVDIATVKNASGTITGTGYWYFDERGLYIQKANAKLDENVWSYIYDATGTQRYYQQTDFNIKQQVIGYHAEMYSENGQKLFRYDHDFQYGRSQYCEFDYDIDQYGNWISEAKYLITRSNGQDHKQLVQYSFRDIEYYED